MTSCGVEVMQASPERIAFQKAAGFVHLTIEEQAQYDELCQFFWNYLLTITIENPPCPSSYIPNRSYLEYLMAADPAKVYRCDLTRLEEHRLFLDGRSQHFTKMSASHF